jgi:hypothetical protein
VLDATVTRRSRSGDIIGPAQRVDVITALKAMTIWPAYQHFEEATKGSIEVGKLADFVILSQDPTAVDPEQIDQIKVSETVKEGQTIYAAAATPARQAALQLGPGNAGGDAFMRLLAAGASARETAAQPAFARPWSLGRHDSACLAGYLDQLRDQALLALAVPR